MSKSLKKLIDINRLREFKNKLVGAGSAYVQTGEVDQTVGGTKAFSKPIVGSVTGSSGSCTGNAATATKATGNANGKELTNTIIKGLSISGKTITYTQIDGNTGTLTTQDTNTDTLMTQNVSTTNNKYPILLCPTANATSNQGAKTGIFGANALINPSTGEIISKSNGTGAFRVVGGNYGFFIRNDGSDTYFLLTASGDQYGSWTSARPLTISNSTGVCSINGNAATATRADSAAKADTATNANYANSAGSVAWGNVSGRPTAVSQFSNDSGYITTDGAAYPRRVGGVTMNFNWSGQGGQPTWLWGGEDGTNMYVYNPANFSVNYATNAGYTNWLRTSSHADHLLHTEWDGSYFWTYVTAGDGGYRAVRVERSNSSGYADSAGNGVPAGVIIPFAGTSVPTGYLLCNGAAVSRTNYANLFAAIGTLYGAGDGSTTFNLPDARDRVLQGASGTHSAGSYIAAGLPNIMGETFIGDTDRYGQGHWGCIWATPRKVDRFTRAAPADIDSAYKLGINAANSNGLYGASSTVQMAAVATNFIIKY